MSARFQNVDRHTPMFLPPTIQEWVREDDLAHFILEALAEMDLSSAVINERGSGDAQYPPMMMMAVLVYCYAHGIMSSRHIEQATYQNVAVRFLSADLHPDHDSIASFRRRNSVLFRSVFVQLLQLAKRSGLLKLGTLAVDGTKIEAAASKRQTYDRSALEEELANLDQQVEALLIAAEAADQQRKGEVGLPRELANAQARREKLRAARAELLAQVEELEAAQRSKAADPQRPGGARARSSAGLDPAQQKVNLSDPQSALTPSHKGFVQGYNAQIVVEVDDPCGLIVAAAVVRDTNDKQQLEPMITQAVENLGQAPCLVLADAGYENFLQSQQLEKRFNIEFLIPPVPSASAKKEGPRRGRKTPWERERHENRVAMRQRLAQPEGRARYRRRGATVEPVIGTLKTKMRMRRFQGRGRMHVSTEWTLACLAFNCCRLVVRRAKKQKD